MNKLKSALNEAVADSKGQLKYSQLFFIKIKKAKVVLNTAIILAVFFFGFEARADELSIIVKPTVPAENEPAVLFSADSPLAGPEFEVGVKVNGVQNLFGVQFDLVYDPLVVEFVSASAGDFMTQGCPSILPPMISKKEPGKVMFAVIRAGGFPPCSTLNGSGEVAKFSFKTIALNAQSELKLENAGYTVFPPPLPPADKTPLATFPAQLTISLVGADNQKPLVGSVSTDGETLGKGSQTIEITFSEPIDDSSQPLMGIDYDSINECPDILNAELSRIDNIHYEYNFDINESCGAGVLAVVTISGAQDLAGNIMEPDSSHSFKVDTIAPELLEAVTNDKNLNGRIDTVSLSFSKPIDGSSFGRVNFEVAGYTVSEANMEGSSTVSLLLIEGSDYDTGVAPLVSVLSVSDLSGNEFSTSSVPSVDGAAPVMIKASVIATTTVEVEFSEDLFGPSISAADFSVEDNEVIDASEEEMGKVILILADAFGSDSFPEITVKGDGTGTEGEGVRDRAGNWSFSHSIAASNDIPANIDESEEQEDTQDDNGEQQPPVQPDDNESSTQDQTPPSIMLHTPAADTVDVSPDISIEIIFSEPVLISPENVELGEAVEFSISGSGTEVIIITPNENLSGNTTYTASLSGVKDLAGNVMADYLWNFTTAASYSIQLYADNGSGWNLISIPVVPKDADIKKVLGEAEEAVDAVWAYDPTNPLADESGWLVYVPGDPEDTNNLAVMTAGYGYWVHVNQDTAISGAGSLFATGPTPPAFRTLVYGWNLIGYYQLPGISEASIEDALISLRYRDGSGFWNSVWGYDNHTGMFTNPDKMAPGQGFWITLGPDKDEYIYTPGFDSE